MKLSSMICALVLVGGLLTNSTGQEAKQNWTHKVRIGAYSLNRNDADKIVRKATEDHVFGIEVDNDIPGRYESFLDPTEKLKVLRNISEQVHKANNKVYVDIPYWMTHFDGWEASWASFDQYTVDAFKEKTGLEAKKDLKLGDFSDANFRKWLDFRIETMTDFVAEIRENARTVNPNIML